MLEKTDKQRSNRLLFVALTIAMVASAGLVLWPRLRSTDELSFTAPRKEQSATQFSIDEPLSVTLYFPSGGTLVTDSVAVKRQTDTQSQARESLVALFADQRISQAPVLRDLKLKAFFLDESGSAYVDLIPDRHKDAGASAWEEYLAICALVNTVLRNFDEIKLVFLLLDGKDAQTLAGHMDLSRPFPKGMDFPVR